MFCQVSSFLVSILKCMPELSVSRCLASAFALLAVVLSGCGGPERPGWGQHTPRPVADLSARIDALLAEAVTPESPGAAVMVVHDGRVLHQAGYGLADVERRVPITPATAFRLASVSKQFVAMAVMILAEDGKLSYDDPVVRHLPELERLGDALTVRHLLNHTGGVSEYYEELETRYAEGPLPTNVEALALMASEGELLFRPGERYRYSNPGYEMLASIVERVSGRPFAPFVAERIFAPLGMRTSVVRDASEPEIAHRALGYSRRDGRLELDDDHRLNHILGAGGIYSTLEDLYLWDQALYDEELVSRETLEEAFSPARLADGDNHPYGFGWRLGRYGALGSSVGHSGSWLGFRTYIVRYPERRFTVVVLSNSSDFPAAHWTGRVVDLAFPSRLIAGATVVDGTGEPARRADVRIEGDRIVEVGDLEPREQDLIVEASGRVLAPGFVDAHSHADGDVLARRSALAAVSQGITTVVTGQDGSSQPQLADFFARLDRRPAAVNLASFAGHGTLRRAVMGEDFARPATSAEVAAMAEILERELAAGALGLSTGLEYDPGIYSTTEEVVALARVAAAAGGRYISHIRSEDRSFWPAIEEVLTIGREAALPVQITHLKLALTSLHGQADRLLERLDEARAEGVEVTADLYPYTYWQSTLKVMFPDRDYEDPRAAAFAVEEVALPDQMTIPVFAPAPELAGKTLAEIATRRGEEPAVTLIELIREAEAFRAGLPPEEREEADVESVIAVSMTEADVEKLMTWPHAGFSTDGELAGAHPRGYGSFPRVLGHYVRDRGVLTLEQAIHKMSGATARRLGIVDRGTLEPGSFADLVLFDPDAVRDRATLDEPHAVADGIERVWVNGRVVYEEGRPSGRRPGRVLRRGD